MSRLFYAILIMIVSINATDAEERKPVEYLSELAQKVIFDEWPSLKDGQIALKVDEYKIEGLWKALKSQIIRVRLLGDDGRQFNEVCLIFHNDQLTGFVPTFGGHGLMSAIVVDDALFYSFSWGSGLHRSHMGKLTIVAGTLSNQISKSYASIDLFVKKIDGKVEVQKGEFVDFNSWFVDFNSWRFIENYGSLSLSVKELVLSDIDESGWMICHEKVLTIVDESGDEISETNFSLFQFQEQELFDDLPERLVSDIL